MSHINICLLHYVCWPCGLGPEEKSSEETQRGKFQLSPPWTEYCNYSHCESWFELRSCCSSLRLSPVLLLSQLIPTPPSRKSSSTTPLFHAKSRDGPCCAATLSWTNGLLPEAPRAISTVVCTWRHAVIRGCQVLLILLYSVCRFIPSSAAQSLGCHHLKSTSGMFCITTTQEHPLAARAYWSQ